MHSNNPCLSTTCVARQVRNRLNTYHNNVDSVVGMYDTVLVRVDGTGSMDEVFDRIDKALESVEVHAAAA